jgi:hypothetical protein
MTHVLKISKVPLILLMILGFLWTSQSACTIVRVYKVNDVRKGFKNTQVKTERALKRITRDVHRHRSIISKAQLKGIANRKPYPELKRLVGAMGKIRDNLVYKQKDIEGLRVRFEKIVGPRRIKVQSNEADYPRVRKVMNELKNLHREMKALVKRYNTKGKAFQKLVHRHQIRR